MFSNNILKCKLINWPTWKTCVCLLSHVWLFATPGTVACQAPLSMEFSRQEHWRLPFPSPGDSPNLGIEFTSVVPACRQILYRWDTGKPSILSTPLTILSCLYLHSIYIIFEWLAYCLVKAEYVTVSFIAVSLGSGTVSFCLLNDWMENIHNPCHFRTGTKYHPKMIAKSVLFFPSFYHKIRGICLI